MPAPSNKAPLPITEIDNSFLESLVGYNTRRATISIVDAFLSRMSTFGFTIVDFSVIALVSHNPGITARQICAVLGILPPNLVPIIASLDKRQLIERRPHPTDGRAVGLHLARRTKATVLAAEAEAVQLEMDATSRLSVSERKTLIALLQKIYK